MPVEFDADSFKPAELKWTEQGPANIGLGVAEMDFGTAPVVVDAVHDALRSGVHGYLSPARSLATRVASAQWQKSRYGWSVDPEISFRTDPVGLCGLHRTTRHGPSVFRWPSTRSRSSVVRLVPDVVIALFRIMTERVS
ncbi:hypothetical protein ACFYVW_13635 [Streptomyces tendae]|uniref:hypothetical protein n=1 Tax=Streptomyces tendae TaxID=1932 RepID=UPI0036BEE10A